MDNKRKRPKRPNTRQSKRQKVDAQAEQPDLIVVLPSISILNYHCLCEIFDWLSKDDLVSFGATCKWAMQAAGHYFQENFAASDLKLLSVSQTPPDFIQYYNCLSIGRFENTITERTVSQSIKSIQSKSFKEIHLKYKYYAETNHEIFDILQTIDSVTLENISLFDIYFDENLLKHCPHLKRLHITTSSVEEGNKWLLQKYPTLEHLELSYGSEDYLDETYGSEEDEPELFKVDLKTFFKMNPNVRSFATNDMLLMDKSVKEMMITSNIKLDTLAVRDDGSEKGGCVDVPEDTPEDSPELLDNFQLYKLLNDLHGRGVFQRLHLHLGTDFKYLNVIASFVGPFIEKLYLDDLSNLDDEGRFWPPALSAMTNLKELGIMYWDGCENGHPIELTENLINLEQLYIEDSDLKLMYQHILEFIRYAPKLKKIHIILEDWGYIWYGDNKQFEDTENDGHRHIHHLKMWQKEREKLVGATKLTIYLSEELYLKTKRAMNTTELPLIELKRAESYVRCNDFYTVSILECGSSIRKKTEPIKTTPEKADRKPVRMSAPSTGGVKENILRNS